MIGEHRAAASILLGVAALLFVGASGMVRAHGEGSFCTRTYDCSPSTTSASDPSTTEPTTTITEKPTTSTTATTATTDPEWRRHRDGPAPTSTPSSSLTTTPATVRAAGTASTRASSTTTTASTLPVLLPTMVPEGSGTNSSLAAAKVESRPVPAGGQGAPWNWIAATVVGLAIAVSLVGLDRRWWSRR